MRWNRVSRYLCASLVLLVAAVSTAEAQGHGRVHVRVGRPVVIAGGFLRSLLQPFFWDYYDHDR